MYNWWNLLAQVNTKAKIGSSNCAKISHAKSGFQMLHYLFFFFFSFRWVMEKEYKAAGLG